MAKALGPLLGLLLLFVSSSAFGAGGVLEACQASATRGPSDPTPVPCPQPVPYPANSVLYTWTYNCPAGSTCAFNGVGVANGPSPTTASSTSILLINLGSQTQPVPAYFVYFAFGPDTWTSFYDIAQIAFNTTMTLQSFVSGASAPATEPYPASDVLYEWDYVCKLATGCNFTGLTNTTSSLYSRARVLWVNLQVGSQTIPTYMTWLTPTAPNALELFTFTQVGPFTTTTNMTIDGFCSGPCSSSGPERQK